MTSINERRVQIDTLFEKYGLGAASDMRRYLARSKNVGNHVLTEPFDDAAADRVMHTCLRLLALPEQRSRFAADSSAHPVYQAMRYEVLARAGVATAITGAEVALAVESRPDLTIFVNSMCGCASGNVRNALGDIAATPALAPNAQPMIAVMAFGGCDGNQTAAPSNAAPEQQSAFDFVRTRLLGSDSVSQSAPAFLVLRNGVQAAFVPRAQLDKQPPQAIVAALARATGV